MDPNFAPARGALGLAYEQKSMFSEAISELRKAAALSGGSTEMLAALGHCYAVSGKRAKAEEMVDELKKLSTRRYVSPYDMALIFVGLQQYDHAFRLLRKASQERCTKVVWSKVEPRLETVRCNPFFQKLLMRLKNEGSTLAVPAGSA
jgi:Flp pilus assembly protein TadD